jgi:hypothetical protein
MSLFKKKASGKIKVAKAMTNIKVEIRIKKGGQRIEFPT